MRFAILTVLLLLFAGISVADVAPECYTDEDCIERGTGNACIEEFYCAYVCSTDEDCMEMNVGNACMMGICGYAQEPDPGIVPGSECETDEDCMELNIGNACMDGICGYAQEPEPFDDTLEMCDDGSVCETNICLTDEQCQEWGIGNECHGGTCAWADQQMDPINAFFMWFWNLFAGLFGLQGM